MRVQARLLRVQVRAYLEAHSHKVVEDNLGAAFVLGVHTHKVVGDSLEGAFVLARLDLGAHSRKVVGDNLGAAFVLGVHSRKVVGDTRKVVEGNHRVVEDSRSLEEAFDLGVQTLG